MLGQFPSSCTLETAPKPKPRAQRLDRLATDPCPEKLKELLSSSPLARSSSHDPLNPKELKQVGIATKLTTPLKPQETFLLPWRARGVASAETMELPRVFGSPGGGLGETERLGPHEWLTVLTNPSMQRRMLEGCRFPTFKLWCRLNRGGGFGRDVLNAITTWAKGLVQLESCLHEAIVYKLMYVCMHVWTDGSAHVPK